VIELVYETHSTSVDNERGIATGGLDGELSETGRAQARELGERRRDDGLSAVYVSDLGRAVETAEIAFAGSHVPAHQDARLRECDYGELNGVPVDRIEAVRLDHLDQPFPGGESYRSVVERTRSFLAELVEAHDGEHVLLIAHRANFCALEHLLRGTSLAEVVGAPFVWRPGWTYVLSAKALSSSSDIE
jgi:broad specificity phosphatase PhoE